MARYGWAAVAALLVFSPAGIASAQQQQPAPFPLPFPDLLKGTPQEEAACAPDSSRFCRRFEPDALQVLGCLQQNRTRISQACQQVLRNRGV
jgi:hypothetical protein